ncbi:hypothetical protein M885DRAFT_114931 [Pelagophyceae sp. CCMP2097]|nr:hypothetical protein M885DRAFT_114931 [Pelagophyceae sp. CCMP2097]
MRVLAALLILACSWVGNGNKGWDSDGGKCEGEDCFVTCHMKHPDAYAQTPPAAGAARKHVPRGLLFKALMYAGAWLAPLPLVAATDWNLEGSLEQASFAVFEDADAVWRTGDRMGWWVHHLSAYEHGVVARAPLHEAMQKVETMINAEVSTVCAGVSQAPKGPLHAKTLAVIPFYGGALSKGVSGNAHSVQPRELKLLGLLASMCSLARSTASRIVVAACAEVEGDAAHLSAFLSNQTSLPPHSWRVVSVDCGPPRLLPFAALRAVVAHASRSEGGHKFVLYSEADLVFRWASPQAQLHAFALLSKFQKSVLTPHRWEKRYGAPPGCGASCGLSANGQNNCHQGSATRGIQFIKRSSEKNASSENAAPYT